MPLQPPLPLPLQFNHRSVESLSRGGAMRIQQETTFAFALTMFCVSTASGAAAQTGDLDLLAVDRDTLKSELQMRFDAALAVTRDSTVIGADDARYLWASEAKIQCAIALGYLKSRTRDETSIGKCDYAYRQMSVVIPPVEPRSVAPPPPPPPPRRAVCEAREPALVFFDWDSDVPGPDAANTIRSTADTARECGWESFRVVGHTDRSGSNAYNDALSVRRAEAVADLMASLGINPERMTIGAEGEDNPRIPTEDGVRSPQNRRVEITVSQ